MSENRFPDWRLIETAPTGDDDFYLVGTDDPADDADFVCIGSDLPPIDFCPWCGKSIKATAEGASPQTKED